MILENIQKNYKINILRVYLANREALFRAGKMQREALRHLLKVYSIVEKILTNHKRTYRILDNSIRFYGILGKKGYGIHINSKQGPARSYKILRDTRQKCYGIHINRKQDPTRFYKILDKNAMESISIVQKMLQDLPKH